MATAIEQQAMQGALLRANVAFVEKLAEEASYDYTSKARLRKIALMGLTTLHEVYTRAVEQAEQVEVTVPDAGSQLSLDLVTP
jgi:hypothetical protein